VTVALGGQGGAGVAFLQPFPFYCGRDVMILTAKGKMTDQEKLWWAICITANHYRFGFGRQANKSLPTLVLPSENKIPNWVNEANLEPFGSAQDAVSKSVPKALKTEAWSAFRYDALFDIKKGQRLTKETMKIGDTPFIGAIDANNGQRQRVSAKPNHEGNTITVTYNGSVAEAFYQPVPYRASDDVNVLYPKFPLNKYVGMFLCVLIRREKFRYNYGRKWHLDRMNETTMRLPVTEEGKPDWLFMEDYVKSLPFSKSM
jgi:hypothetical protein